MKAAIYLRVSTDRCRCGHVPNAHGILVGGEGVKYGGSCSRCFPACKRYEPDQDESNQEPACRKLCEARGWSDPLVVRERKSGAKARPEWRALVEQVRKGEVGAVVFWAVDRIGRNKVQSAHDLRELARFGAQLVSVQDAWVDQPEGPLRNLMIDIITWMAEGERARLIERTKAGMAAAAKAGKSIGRPVVEVNVERAVSMICDGKTLSAVARTLGVSRGTVKKALPDIVRKHLSKRGMQKGPDPRVKKLENLDSSSDD